MKSGLVKLSLCFIAMFMMFGICKKEDEEPVVEKIPRLEESDQWSLAQEQNSLRAYEAYMEFHPDGPRAGEAKAVLMDSWDAKTQELTPEQMENLTAVIETNYGTIKLKFYPHDAEGHVRNFIRLAKSRFYDGLIFHRLVPRFVIQGGDPLGTGAGGPGYQIDAEFNEQRHLEGTLAMARSSHPDSAGSQFYICLAPQPNLDRRYTVFGQVIEGMDVVHTIGRLPTVRSRPVRAVIDADGNHLDVELDRNGLPTGGPLPAGAKFLDIPVMSRVYIEGL